MRTKDNILFDCVHAKDYILFDCFGSIQRTERILFYWIALLVSGTRQGLNFIPLFC